MSHPLVLAMFRDKIDAARGADAARRLGIASDDLSVIARDHSEEGHLARELGGSPGVDLEDSRLAAVLGEIGGEAVAAIALVMPGIGPVVAVGPLSAALGELAGHAAGGIASTLVDAGVPDGVAAEWEAHVRAGGLLLGVHVRRGRAQDVARVLEEAGAGRVIVATWP